ncbi:MAG: ABC transporter permease [Oscillospiraceae bacterium]|nr:ABC transporter permease [Oscillospiraceae bacterium]
MDFIKLIWLEVRNILKSRFLTVIGALVLSLGVLLPVFTNVVSPAVGKLVNKKYDEPEVYAAGYDGVYYDAPYTVVMNAYYPPVKTTAAASVPSYEPEYTDPDTKEPVYPTENYTEFFYVYNYGDELEADGVKINESNPFYYYILDISNAKYNAEKYAETPETARIASEIFDLGLKFYADASRYIKEWDFRCDVATGSYTYLLFDEPDEDFNYDNTGLLYSKYILEYDGNIENIRSVFTSISHYFNSDYANLTSEQKAEKIKKIDGVLNIIDSIIKNSDYPAYLDLRIKAEQRAMQSLYEEKARIEKEIIEQPENEEYYNNYYLEDIKRQLKYVEEITIPLLEYRKDKNIMENDGSWQNNAIWDIENNWSNVAYFHIIPEEEFMQEFYYYGREYGSYQDYLKHVEKEKAEYQNNIEVAKKSIESGKPDMKFVYDGARQNTQDFLMFSVIAAIFAVLLGGWLMASEFQFGTVRLLLITPKSRMKILFSKYFSALALSLSVYIGGCFLNMIANGVFKGFRDLTYPVYTAAGELSFLAYYTPKMLACAVTVVFALSAAFMLSVLIKNIAVSVITPVVCYVGSLITMSMTSYRAGFGWFAYTPLPYLNLYSFFTQDYYSSGFYPMISAVSRLSYGLGMGYGGYWGTALNLTYGIILLFGLSVMFTGLAALVFKKQDITN